MPEKLARSVVVTPCCRHHSLTERPLLRHSWICVAHSCSSARCFNSALVILTPHNTTVAKPFATFRYYCLMCVYARLGLTVTKKKVEFHHPRKRILWHDLKSSIAKQRRIRCRYNIDSKKNLLIVLRGWLISSISHPPSLIICRNP